MVTVNATTTAQWHKQLLTLTKPGYTPHCFNLLHQCTTKSAAHAKSFNALTQIIPAYFSLISCLNKFDPAAIDNSSKLATRKFDEYMRVLRLPTNDVFSSVSDLKTSAIPEFFLRLFSKLLQHHGAALLEASGQREIPVELSFDIRAEKFVVARTQRVDAAIVIKKSLHVDGNELEGFCIPIFAAEAKTYFDKNMLSGVDQSAAGMKATFPHCLYFSIGEFADFELSAHSYASGAIDEIYILRHQKRAEFRKSSVAQPIDPSLVSEILTKVEAAILSHNIKRSKLDDRLPTGKLIG